MGTSHTIASCPALGCSYRELREEGTSTHLSQDLVQGLQNELHEAALGAARWGLFGELAAVGGYKERYEEQELLQTRPLLSPGHLLPPNTPPGSIHGHGSRMCSKKKPEQALLPLMGFKRTTWIHTKQEPHSTIHRYYSITGQLRPEGTLGGHLAHVLQGKEEKKQQ